MVVKKAASKKKVDDDDDDDFEDFAEDWSPQEGDEGDILSGTITEKRSGIETEYQDNAKAVTITEQDGTDRNVWMGVILKSKLWKKYDEGEDVSIRFDGLKGKRMKLFTVKPGLDAFNDEDEDEEEEEDDE